MTTPGPRASSSMQRTLRLGALATLFASGLVHASCAADGAPEEAKRPLVEPPVEASVIPDGDGGLDARGADADADAGPSLSCDVVDWCPIATGLEPLYTLTAVWGSGSQDVWAVGSGGAVVRWGGAAWKKMTPVTPGTLLGVWGSGPNDIWAVGSGNILLHSTGGAAATFTFAPPAVSWGGRRMRTVWGTSATDVRIGGENVALVDEFDNYLGSFSEFQLTSGDGGLAWQGVSNGGYTFTINGLWGAASNDTWIVADNSTAVPYQAGMALHGRATDAGAVYEEVDTQTLSRLDAIWGSSAKDIWVVGVHGTIRHFTGGTRFELVDSHVTADLHAVWGSGPKDVWAVGDGGTVVHFDGTTWKVATTGLAAGARPTLTGVWGSSANDVWAVGGTTALHFTGSRQ